MGRFLRMMLLFSAAGAIGSAGAERIPMSRIRAEHPRLLVGEEEFQSLKRNAATPEGRALAERIIHDAESLLEVPPQERRMEGRRLLMASRTVLFRVTTLCVAEKLTNSRKYADRAIREMVTAAEYSDWNPSHFLDVGEMTLALAIGCDWLYDAMTPEQRELVQRAIVEKGLKPSFQGKQWWVTGDNNWNPVCHAGMVAGALCVADLEPELAEKTVARAVENLPRSMKASYFPNGTYPEGPMYWGYGTEFTVVLLGLLNAAFGEDFGLSAQSGFSQTGDFIRAVTGPTGKFFNYADCTTWRGADFAMIYLAKKFNRPDWFDRIERKLLLGYAQARPKGGRTGNRLLPLALLYLGVPGESRPAPLSYYSGDEALVPIAVLRSDQTANAAWIGLKGGAPAGPHGHMDGGSFVFETGGCRWAVDLGMENYTKIEATSVKLWDSRQEGGRWTLFRLGPESHNILRIGGAPQNVKGKARFVKHSETSATMDLTPLYTPAARQVTRTASLLPGRAMELRDRLTGLAPGVPVCWQMCTESDPEALPDGSLRLRHGKRSLILKKNHPGAWRIVPAEELRKPFESPNRRAKMVRFEVAAPESGRLELVVNFLPE